MSYSRAHVRSTVVLASNSAITLLGGVTGWITWYAVLRTVTSLPVPHYKVFNLFSAVSRVNRDAPEFT